MIGPLDLDAIAAEFLQQCGPCDYAIPADCRCPERDYRPTMLDLVREVERLRDDRREIQVETLRRVAEHVHDLAERGGSPEASALRAYLIRRRKQLGRTQAEVARFMGTTQSALSDLESGRTLNPTLNTLVRWAGGVDVELAIQIGEVHTRSFPIEPRCAEQASGGAA